MSKRPQFFGEPRLAEVFSRNVARVLNIPNRGPKSDTMSGPGELGWLRKIKCQSVLIECLYLTNSEDLKALDEYKIAEGIKNAVFELTSGNKEKQIETGFVVKEIGNPYSASSLIGLCKVLDEAKANKKILLASYGSGAGSDVISLTTTSWIVKGRKKARSEKSGEEKNKYINYGEYRALYE